MNERTFDPANAHRLEDPQRLAWTPPDEIIGRLGLKSGMVVADIGAGTGFFALPFAGAVHPLGMVWAVDVQPEMLCLLQQKLAREGAASGVRLVEGDAAHTGLPNGAYDVVFLANLWHELDGHRAVLAESRRILRACGRIAILDWRPGVAQPPGPPLSHRIPLTQIEDSLQDDGWCLLASAELGPYSYFVTASPPVEPR
ncbi:MAG TPA: class I SAM-dependent methyltransferase [Bryobacteraceae bacterium]|nr:class I SAM-dependent methyltransferase [Bryobacteraceae bacterium]